MCLSTACTGHGSSASFYAQVMNHKPWPSTLNQPAAVTLPWEAQMVHRRPLRQRRVPYSRLLPQNCLPSSGSWRQTGRPVSSGSRSSWPRGHTTGRPTPPVRRSSRTAASARSASSGRSPCLLWCELDLRPSATRPVPVNLSCGRFSNLQCVINASTRKYERGISCVHANLEPPQHHASPCPYEVHV